jgi:hypothetical protein
MKTNNIVETKRKVVGKHFRLTFVFNALKTPLNLYLNSLKDLSLFLVFEIREVLSIKTCLKGGNLINLTMHAPWCITGCPLHHLSSNHMQRMSMEAAKALYYKNIMEECEAREHGSDSKKKHQVEGPIMQIKE